MTNDSFIDGPANPYHLIDDANFTARLAVGQAIGTINEYCSLDFAAMADSDVERFQTLFAAAVSAHIAAHNTYQMASAHKYASERIANAIREAAQFLPKPESLKPEMEELVEGMYDIHSQLGSLDNVATELHKLGTHLPAAMRTGVNTIEDAIHDLKA